MRNLPEDGINLEDSIKHDSSNSFLMVNYITSFGGLYQVTPLTKTPIDWGFQFSEAPYHLGMVTGGTLALFLLFS